MTFTEQIKGGLIRKARKPDIQFQRMKETTERKWREGMGQRVDLFGTIRINKQWRDSETSHWTVGHENHSSVDGKTLVSHTVLCVCRGNLISPSGNQTSTSITNQSYQGSLPIKGCSDSSDPFGRISVRLSATQTPTFYCLVKADHVVPLHLWTRV